MGSKSFRIAACVLAVVIAALAGLNIRQAQKRAWGVC